MSFIIKSGYQKNLDEHQGLDRFERWIELVNNEFVSLDCDRYKDSKVDNFDSEIRGGIGLGKVHFSEVISNPQVVRRTYERISAAGEDDFLMSFQLEKNCLIEQSGKQAYLTPGSFALYDSTEPYTLSFPENFHQFIIQMPRELLSRHLIQPEKYVATTINASSGLGLVLKDFIFSLVGELSSSDASPNELLSENLVNLIALSFSSTVFHNDIAESDSVKSALIRRIYQFVENNLFDPKLSNGCIAESQGISVRYLHKLFQQEDESIHEMILNKRLAAAHELLLSESEVKRTVESIAYHVGFSGAPHFSRAFKAKYGMSPSDVAK